MSVYLTADKPPPKPDEVVNAPAPVIGPKLLPEFDVILVIN